MRYTKQLTVALAALGISTAVLANDTVYIPNQHAGFKVSVDANYLRENSVTPMVSDEYDFGYHLQAGYLFENTANDVTLHYIYFNTSNSNSDADPRNNISFEGNKECDLDTLDLELGQRLVFDCLDMRLFAGVRYTELGHELGLNVVGGKGEDYQSFETTLNAIGPRMGADARYCLGAGFGFDAHVNTALLVGKIKSTYRQNEDFQLDHTTNRVVPTMDAKLGFDFNQSFKDKSCMAVEVGYETSHYFKALDASALNAEGDASFNGTYLEVKYYS